MTVHTSQEAYLRSIIDEYDRHDAVMLERLNHLLAKARERFDRDTEQEILNELALRADERQRRLAPVFGQLVQLEAMKPRPPVVIPADGLPKVGTPILE